MKYVILLILGAMWAGVGISWLRSRTGPRGTNSISAFSNHLTVLARTSPARNGMAVVDERSMAPVPRAVPYGATPYGSAPRMSRQQVQKRRRDVLAVLGGGTGLVFLLAIAAGGIFWLLTLVGIGLTGAYVALLLRLQSMAAERQAKVHYLPHAAEEPVVEDDHSVLVLSRSAN